MADNRKVALEADDVEDGLRYLQGELTRGRAGIYLGTGPDGFALLVGHMKASTMAGGVVLGFPLSRENLLTLRERCTDLLEGRGGSRVVVLS